MLRAMKVPHLGTGEFLPGLTSYVHLSGAPSLLETETEDKPVVKGRHQCHQAREPVLRKERKSHRRQWARVAGGRLRGPHGGGTCPTTPTLMLAVF